MPSPAQAPRAPGSDTEPFPTQRRSNGRYAVEQRLATGGMGVVYRVLDRVTNQRRALKRLTREAARDPAQVEAFRREFQVLTGLDHPRIIRVYDYEVDSEGPFYTMELLDGEDMRAAAPCSARDACLLLRDVATSLALLHARRLIHRDLSPTNVRRTPDGRCKLIDFGALADFGRAATIVGTAPAIPPESLHGELLDQRTDLYSLGALAYFLLTGRHAYPVKDIHDLLGAWERPLEPPSRWVADVPGELDALVMALLSQDPRGRPATAAEVIARLSTIGDLPPEDADAAARLAQSFLLSARFAGRTVELSALEGKVRAATQGRGAAVLIEGNAGMGRTRLLEEVSVRAQLAGTTVVRVDASVERSAHGTARALVTRLLEAAPEPARAASHPYRATLLALGDGIQRLLPAARDVEGSCADLERWFAEVSHVRPVLLAIDNVEQADDSSLGLIAALAQVSASAPLLLIATERRHRGATRVAKGLSSLRSRASSIVLQGLSSEEILELSRSLFDEAPNITRFADWLHDFTAGSPLHCIEVVRQLVMKRAIRYIDGLWVLPGERPDAEMPAALEDVLSMRLERLSPDARALAECLAVLRTRPTRALCLRVMHGDEDLGLACLDELARSDVLSRDGDTLRFSTLALRDAVLAVMSEDARALSHKRVGEALLGLAGPEDPGLSIEAGFQLIKGGDDERGADLIASVAADSVVTRRLIANLHRPARAIEAALQVYKRARRSRYERLPLLAALASAGYYEERSYGQLYGDEALDVVEDVSGLRFARRLRPYFGRPIALVIAIVFAISRFHLVPKHERRYGFREVLVQAFTVTTCLTGAAALSFDVTRAAKVAHVLSPFSCLPRRLTPVGIYQFCRALASIGREYPASTYHEFDRLLGHFRDPRYYPSLTPENRKLYVYAAHYARAAFSIFRADARGTVESTDALIGSDLALYRMIGNQIRSLFHASRGEVAEAESYRAGVELHAARVGSAWQVETWEGPSLLTTRASTRDIVAMIRTASQIEASGKSVASLRPYIRIARAGTLLVTMDWESAVEVFLNEAKGHEPRSYLGWAAVHGFAARALNALGRHEEARELCEVALAQMTDEDRDYPLLFLVLDLETALADAALQRLDAAFARVDDLLARYQSSGHPLVLGLLHETRASIAHVAARDSDYEQGLLEAERYYRSTGASALISRVEQLAALGGAARRPVEDAPPAEDAASTSETATVQGALAVRRSQPC